MKKNDRKTKSKSKMIQCFEKNAFDLGQMMVLKGGCCDLGDIIPPPPPPPPPANTNSSSGG